MFRHILLGLVFLASAMWFTTVSLTAQLFDADAGVISIKEGRATRILIDSSKDGGLWWFPQGKDGFDAEEPHQGKALADSMREVGWEVTELGRGPEVTFETLAGFDIVIRPSCYFPYADAESSAIEQYVADGGTLILMGACHKSTRDPIPSEFGLTVVSRGPGEVAEWIDHPVVTGIARLQCPWSVLTRMPEHALSLASLGPATYDTVAAFHMHEKGSVFYIGTNLGIRNNTGPLLIGALSSLIEMPHHDFYHELAMSSVLTAKPARGPHPPALLYPESFTVLAQPRSAAWTFDWEDVPQAAIYQIVVLGPSAAFPLIDKQVSESEFTASQSGGYIADHNLQGWSWRVRARDYRGEWGSWSEARKFDVAPLSQPADGR